MIKIYGKWRGLLLSICMVGIADAFETEKSSSSHAFYF
ncbi:hypothetical protein M2459_001091 [Parabacteroides sp. PF5-5]|nr:hypothetical protein [Parabacteroides sp. PH5-8]MDH6326681.1 hypothetical protein [Parabacteroides sp. PH5-41]MDH6334349.1 hypothetical protein [Parabacteroides sp. PF5-5]MDH6345546.1 hypothetical protein [Parabacteroides sp. PH5-46]MDH6360502.1 hypothetical protein [Parabacteroides sp. PH5-16]MDH6376037.1 hypothetical protein [Parabacteroides sp. PH5-33]MDH6383991.1 hypothetical protein [Parabacteroides sp. PH5-17]MDH6393517.1 hypothetical protein [Parabacteroides sp. PFB2-22]MDH6406457